MRIKKYIARSMPEAMNQIKKELGNDAVILNSKEIKTGGFLGLFQKRQIEVIAALEKKPQKTKPKSERSLTTDTIELLKQEKNDAKVLKEIKHLQQLLETQSFQSEYRFPPNYENAYKYLLDQEVEEEIAKNIISSILEQYKDNGNLSTEQLKSYLHMELERKLDKTPFRGISLKSKIIHFVGPTGVGKTTTLAKVAAKSMLDHNKKIAFITTDTYRIAAIEQLKTYARILDVPVEVVYSVDDYMNAIHQFQSYDQIFVDTAGRNFRDERYVDELKHIIGTNSQNIETFLVLALTAKAQDIRDIYNQFKSLSIDNIIFTKVDETLTYGSILNLCVNEKVGIAYVTNGQNVPDDLIEPDRKLISELIVSRYANV